MGVGTYGPCYKDDSIDFMFAEHYLADENEKQPIYLLPQIQQASISPVIGSFVPLRSMESFSQGHNMIIKIEKSYEEWVNIMADNKLLKIQVNNLNALLDEKDKLWDVLFNKYIQKCLQSGESITDIMFELYGEGIVTISQVKKYAKINQYQFVKILAQKGMNFVYPTEDDTEKKDRISKLLELPTRSK